MRFQNFMYKYDKGVAGTNVLLGLVVSLFVIGLLVMIFALMGSSLRTASFDSTTATVTNETGAWINTTEYVVDGSTANGFSSLVITGLLNLTANEPIVLANITTTTTGFTNATAILWEDEVYVSYTYVFNAENTATRVINDTTEAIAGATDFFDLFIVIGSMVVLVLLTIIIIVAIRNSGMLDVGTA